MAKRKQASRFYVRRADREHIWTISVFDVDTFGPSPDLDVLAILNGAQWVRQNAGLERATLMRTIVFMNSIYTYTAAAGTAGPADFNWALYMTDEDDTTADSPSGAALYSEDIMRFGISNHAQRFAAANSANVAEVSPSLMIDARTRRRMTTDSQVRLALEWNGVGALQSGSFRCIARCLVKLA